MNTSSTRIAECAHEANRALCAAFGDTSQPSWADAPDWQKDSAVSGVAFHQTYPNAGPAASHRNWMTQKLNDGWTWGEVKDADAKTHPCMIEYNDLPADQRAKDFVFCAIVKTLSRRFIPCPPLPSQRQTG